MATTKQPSILAIDIGSSAIRALTASTRPDATARIEAFAERPLGAAGDPAPVSPADLSAAIRDTLDSLGLPAIVDVAATVGVTGPGLSSSLFSGEVQVDGPRNIVGAQHVQLALDACSRAARTSAMSTLHIMPVDTRVDGAATTDPIGRNAVRIEVRALAVSFPEREIARVESALREAGIETAQVLSSALASADCALLPAEKHAGTCLIEIGAATTAYVVYDDDRPMLAGCIPVGGTFVTSDLAELLKMTLEDAERLKVEHGAALRSDTGPNASPDRTVPVIQIGRAAPRRLPTDLVNGIIEARMRETLEIVREEIGDAGLPQAPAAGVVLTGGGSCIPSLDRLAAEVFGTRARRGRPGGLDGIDTALGEPRWSSAIGLALHAAHEMEAHIRSGARRRAGGAIMTGLQRIRDSWRI